MFKSIALVAALFALTAPAQAELVTLHSLKWCNCTDTTIRTTMCHTKWVSAGTETSSRASGGDSAPGGASLTGSVSVAQKTFVETGLSSCVTLSQQPSTCYFFEYNLWCYTKQSWFYSEKVCKLTGVSLQSTPATAEDC